MFDDLLSNLRRVAPDRADIEILQPADPFLETAGEDLRRRIFITDSVDGTSLCLRPEFTIPICLSHLKQPGKPGVSARYAYGGTVFRQARLGAAEFRQVGLEDLGNPDSVAADVACIADFLTALAGVKAPRATIELGDQELFAVVVESLQLPIGVAQRLVRSFGDAELLEAQISRLSAQTNGVAEPSEAESLALAGDLSALIGHVRQKMDAARLQAHAGRSAEAIAERMMERVRESRFQLEPESAEILRNFLNLKVSMTEAPDVLQDFAKQSGLSFGLAGKRFFERAEAMADAGIDLSCIHYRASMGRNLEYYTGIVFEVAVGSQTVGGGGRYDRLCGLLGAAEPIPAVGFSISLDRLEAAL